ncbi:MAG: ATP-dependent 6-phosphofructokinase [Gammaproteobacteria bacterium]|nr:ATP-dependent 6-phosphofructokinase [Gammaproteobacteria bacterium]
MSSPRPPKRIGILTAGGDCQGLNAALRAVTLAAMEQWDAQLIGFENGFIGLEAGQCRPLHRPDVVSIINLGGSILGTGRGAQAVTPRDTEESLRRCVANYRAESLDLLVCLGGDGTQRFAQQLSSAGLRLLTLPKTIDNDIPGTDTCFGFDSAIEVGVDALDRLHTTTSSHHRVMLVEVMGRHAGWLAAAVGLAGGADIVLLPEIPYDLETVAAAVKARGTRGRHYAMVVVAEGAQPANARPEGLPLHGAAAELLETLPALTGLQTRLTTLGYLMRGGAPSATDRILASELGVRASQLMAKPALGLMLAWRQGAVVPVPLTEIAGPARQVPPDHPLLETLRATGVCLGV